MDACPAAQIVRHPVFLTIMASPPLPTNIPIFPLAGALMFPRAVLPLHIFEPRYRAMIRDAIAADRVIGMVQPRDEANRPALFAIGGLGRINQCTETADGRFVLQLDGVSRFRIERELEATTPYRQVIARYDGFDDDLQTPTPLMPAMRAALEAGLLAYLDTASLSADWEAVTASDDETLVNTLAASCPFAPSEKQALLEAGELHERAEMLLQLMQFASAMPEPPETLQ